MLNKPRRTRAALAVALIAVLAATAVAVPMLDRGAGAGPYAVSAGDLPIGWVDHDHRICLQYSAMAWLPGVGARAPSGALRQPDRVDLSSGERPVLAFPTSYHPRAPPRL